VKQRLDGRVAWITGAGRGLGRAIALAYAEAGADLFLTARTASELEETAKAAQGRGADADWCTADVRSKAAVESAYERALERFGRIDVLVNNAGVVAGGRLDDIGADDVRRMVDVNIWATIRLTQLALPHMREAKSGTIINISSLAGRMGVPFYATYCASKFAVRGFSEALRRELRPDGIHVMGVYPGGTATDMIENVEFDRLGMTIATADQVARIIVRGVRWKQAEVFIGLGENLISRWNDIMPWSMDIGVEMLRGRMEAAVQNQRTT